MSISTPYRILGSSYLLLFVFYFVTFSYRTLAQFNAHLNYVKITFADILAFWMGTFKIPENVVFVGGQSFTLWTAIKLNYVNNTIDSLIGVGLLLMIGLLLLFISKEFFLSRPLHLSIYLGIIVMLGILSFFWVSKFWAGSLQLLFLLVEFIITLSVIICFILSLIKLRKMKLLNKE